MKRKEPEGKIYANRNPREHIREGAVDAKLDLWMGMPHGFVGSVGNLQAAKQALRDIGAFLHGRLQQAP